jgi:hypothetical protein
MIRPDSRNQARGRGNLLTSLATRYEVRTRKASGSSFACVEIAACESSRNTCTKSCTVWPRGNGSSAGPSPVLDWHGALHEVGHVTAETR